MAWALVLGALAVALTLGVTSAFAAHAKVGEIKEANSKALAEPWGLAFDNSGNLFVGDPGEKVVDQFSSSNAFECQIGAGEFPENFTRNLTVNYAKGLVYVAESGPEQVWVYKHESGCGYKLVQKVQFEHFLEVAYDNSSGPNKGDLYVVGAPHKVWVAKTNSEGLLGEGNFEEATLFESLPTLTAPVGGFELSGENGKGAITVDNANGEVFLTEPPHKVISVYGPEGVFQKKIEGVNTKGKSFEPFGIGIEESTGHLYVYDHTHHVVDEIASTEEKPASVSEITEGITSEAVAVGVSNAGANKHEIYVSDVTAGAAKVNIYEATPAPKRLLTVEKTGTGTGTVTSTPSGISCGATCSHEFEEGEEVTLKEAPNGNSTFVGWSGACSGAEETCKVTMSVAKTVGAQFALKPPVNTGLPKAEGTAKEGHTLKANPGSWEGSPSSYAFVWEDCDSLGASCSTIATGEEYTLTSADVGHTVRVVVTAKNAGGSSAPATSEPTAVVIASGSEEASASSTVEGEVPKTTTLASTCEKVYLGEFKPGVEETYAQHCALTVTSTGAESSLTAADETGKETGHLENGAYYLAKPLETKASGIAELGGASGTGGVLAPLTSPVTLLTYATPVSADEVTLQFSQKIGKHDPLHTGKYAKVITLTLKQTKP